MTKTKTASYRVIAILTNDFGAYNHGHPSKVDETIKWSGTDLDDLSREYPPSNIFGADPLGHSEIEDGLIRFDYRFERQREDGTWEEIDDPRRRITPMTDYEYEIDAENRRLFPGDYITEDDDDGYDDGYDQYYCDNCRDAGCERCDAAVYPERCNDCSEWFEPELLNADGVCAECQDYREEEAKPHCCACSQVHTDPKLQDGDICKSCDGYYNSLDEEWDVPQPERWYRRVINRLFRRR